MDRRSTARGRDAAGVAAETRSAAAVGKRREAGVVIANAAAAETDAGAAAGSADAAESGEGATKTTTSTADDRGVRVQSRRRKALPGETGEWMGVFLFTVCLNSAVVFCRLPLDNLTPEERDARTVFCMQLAARIRPRDLEEFFSAVGKVLGYHGHACLGPSPQVRDVRMISDRNSRRSKGIAYIEFVEASSVPLAIGLTGQRLLGVPIIVQASQVLACHLFRHMGVHINARRLQNPRNGLLLLTSATSGTGGVHHRCVFWCQFADAECAKKALEQLNGFELAGRPMKVGHVTERTDASVASSFLDNDELERSGVDLGTTGRLQLMARLAEGEATSLVTPDVNLDKISSHLERSPMCLYRYRSADPSCCSAGSTDERSDCYWSAGCCVR
ncbi:RNA-binding protein 39 [Goodea atripinnis]|uniref:RNA-binding protein 39 n=1 Tax=Goodea atripinnis TaxID=208336 RepID=A0ABV0NH35_9TELE